MAKHHKTGGRDFKPGQSGNPNGRPRLPEDVKEARRLNQVELERVVNKYLSMSVGRLERKANDPRVRGLDRLVIGILLRGFRGEPACTNFFLDRVVGKVKTTVEITNPEKSAVPLEERVANMSTEEKEKRLAELLAKGKG